MPEDRPKGIDEETRLRWRMRDCAQKLTYAAGVRACGRFAADRRRGNSVTLRLNRDNGRPYFTGLLRCNSVWECPNCVVRVQWARAEELRAFGKAHRAAGGAVLLASLTIAHDEGDYLKPSRQLVAQGWSSLVRGAPWKRWEKRLGIIGYVRALEGTHGPNGWHPHLHVALYLRRRPQASVAEPNVSRHAAGGRELVRFRDWLRQAWAHRVARSGYYRRPVRQFTCADGRVLELLDAAVRLSAATSDDYIAKMGLTRELVSSSTKRGRDGHRTYMQILRDLTEHRQAGDFKLWREWIRAMRGAKQLTYSPGFRNWQAIYGLHVLTDAELADVQGDLELPFDPEADSELVYTFDAADWYNIISSPRSVALRLMLLEVPIRYPPAEWRDMCVLLVRRAMWWRPLYRPEPAAAA